MDEITAAASLLVHCQQFSCGMAAAVSSHIRQHLGSEFCWKEFGDRAYLEHAMLLGLEPLRELLTFLWVQLGLKLQLLDPYIEAQQMLRCPVSPFLQAGCSPLTLFTGS